MSDTSSLNSGVPTLNGVGQYSVMSVKGAPIKIAANERGLALWRYSVIRQPGAAAPRLSIRLQI